MAAIRIIRKEMSRVHTGETKANMKGKYTLVTKHYYTVTRKTENSGELNMSFFFLAYLFFNCTFCR